MALRLDHPDLFGNDAAEDEAPERLVHYFVDKDIFKTFRDPNVRLSIARARKGIGKSAVLAYTAYVVAQKDTADCIVVQLKGSDLVAQRPLPPIRADVLIYDWQQRICTAILLRLVQRLNIAPDDDRLAMIEAAELAGFRKRNIVSALLDRLRIKLAGNEIGVAKCGVADAAEVLRRHQGDERRPHVWVFIDDIDATFIDSAEERVRLATFFSAVRKLASDVDGISLRCCVRSDVWTMIRQSDEALDKVEQYSFDILWSEDEILAILANRIRSFIYFTLGSDAAKLPADMIERQRHYVEQAFSSPYQWAGHKRPPHIVIDTLSHGRPRWAIQLCRMSAKSAAAAGRGLIALEDIDRNLKDYGQQRVDDLNREHRHQCPQIGELVSAFVKQPSKYQTDQLVTTIRNRICTHFAPAIDGRQRSDPVEIAQFLFRIGFLTARDDLDEADYRHYTYEELPQLLVNRANLDYGYSWEIHPCYRQYLQLQGFIPDAPRKRRR